MAQQEPSAATSRLLRQSIQNIRNALMREGHSEDDAHALAVAAVERWKDGGDNVTPEVRQASQQAYEQWMQLRSDHP